MGRQHQGMHGGMACMEFGKQGEIQKSGCKIMSGAPTTIAVEGLMMMMMMMMMNRREASASS